MNQPTEKPAAPTAADTPVEPAPTSPVAPGQPAGAPDALPEKANLRPLLISTLVVIGVFAAIWAVIWITLVLPAREKMKREPIRLQPQTRPAANS